MGSRPPGRQSLLDPIDSYLTVRSEEQKQVGVQVNRAVPMLKRTLIDLLSDMRSRAQVASTYRWSALCLSVFL